MLGMSINGMARKSTMFQPWFLHVFTNVFDIKNEGGPLDFPFSIPLPNRILSLPMTQILGCVLKSSNMAGWEIPSK